jgi:hypothetical protein
MKRTCLVTLAALLPFFTACGNGPTAPTGEPDYVGYISDLSRNSAYVKAIDDPCGILLALGPETYYGVSGRSAKLGDLRAGLLAEVWVTGSIRDSCPMQATARAITVD